jgi:hypothetical protein
LESSSGSKYQAPDLTRRKLPMRYVRILLIGLVAIVAFAWSAAAIENADELARYCQSLDRGAKGAISEYQARLAEIESAVRTFKVGRRESCHQQLAVAVGCRYIRIETRAADESQLTTKY